MPKLPDPYQPQSVPQSGARVVSFDPTQATRARGEAAVRGAETEAKLARREGQTAMQNLRRETQARSDLFHSEANLAKAQGQEAAVLQDVGDYLYRQAEAMQDRVDRREYTAAKSDFLKQKALLDSGFERDTDFKTFEERYSKQINEIRDRTAGNIDNNAVRQAFIDEMDVNIAQGLAKVNSMALVQERDSGRAGLVADLDNLLETAYRAPDEYTREQAILAANESIEFAQENSYIDAEEAGRIRRDFNADYANIKAKTLPPEEVLKFARQERQNPNSTFLRYLPPEDRIDVVNAAESETRKAEAMGIVDTYTMLGLDLEQGMNEARQIEDPALRAEVETRFEKMYQLREKQEEEAMEQRLEQALAVIDKGGFISDIPAEDYIRFPKSERDNLEEYWKIKNGLVSRNEVQALEFYDRVARDYSADPKSVLNYSVPSLMAQLPEDKLDKVMGWRQAATAGDTRVEALESHITSMQRQVVEELSLSDKNSAIFRGVMDKELAYFTEQHDRKPTYKEAEEIKDRLVEEYAFNRSWLVPGTTKRYGFQIRGDEDFSTLVVPDEDRNLILQRTQQRNPDALLTEEQIRDIYINWKYGDAR